jgi:hypothetical protein
MTPQTIARSISVGGSLLIFLAMFGLNWVAFGGFDQFTGSLRDQISAIPEGAQFIQVLQVLDETVTLTGWDLMNDVPTMGSGMRTILMLAFATGILGLSSAALGMTVGGQVAAMVAIIQAGLGLVSVILLFFTSNRIRFLGFDPRDFGMLGGLLNVGASFLNLTVGIGFYVCIGGLLLCAVGGGLSIDQSAGGRRRPGTRTAGRRRVSTRRR